MQSIPLPETAKLQIVPSSNTSTFAQSLTILSVLQLSAQCSDSGTDILHAQLADSAGATIPSPQIAITTNNPPADSDWQDGSSTVSVNIPTPASTGVFLGSVTPTSWNVFGKVIRRIIP